MNECMYMPGKLDNFSTRKCQKYRLVKIFIKSDQRTRNVRVGADNVQVCISGIDTLNDAIMSTNKDIILKLADGLPATSEGTKHFIQQLLRV